MKQERKIIPTDQDPGIAYGDTHILRVVTI